MRSYIFRVEKRKYSYFAIYFDYDENIVKAVKRIPTATFNSNDKSWTVKASNETAPYIDDLLSIGFECTQDVLDMIDSYRSQKEILFDLSDSEDANINLPELPNKLYPFQKAGIKYMVTAKRCFNADDMGLGKTVQTLVAMEVADAYPHIIICPDKMKTKWRRHIAEWMPHRSSMILNENNFYYDYDVMILNYEAVIKYLVMEIRDPERSSFKVREFIKRIGIKGLTCDESHYLKSNKSKRTRAVKKLSEGMKYIWMLSGTFVSNRPEEIIPQLQIMGRLHDIGGYQFFINKYCDAKKGFGDTIDRSGASNLIELNEKLKKVCMVRRLRKEVIKELPGKTRRSVPVEIDNREEYELAQRDLFAWMERDEIKKYENDLGFEKDFEKRRMSQDIIELQIINALRLITARGKINSCVEWIRRFLKSGNKLVVFAHHIEIQKRLIKEFPGCARIVSGMNGIEQEKNEDMFKKKGCNIIICSLKSANEGIDLVSANNYYCVEYDWNPATHDQAEDRLDRIGQHKLVNCYYPTAIDTIEEDIYMLHEKKREIMKGVMDGEEYKKSADIKQELIKILKEKGNINIKYG